ncbi:hypothetical protein HWV62_5457 [Athelia sp. TMB]|nr:hypothetical protein HWV62_5457 [Athelia sp. TMB]
MSGASNSYGGADGGGSSGGSRGGGQGGERQGGGRRSANDGADRLRRVSRLNVDLLEPDGLSQYLAYVFGGDLSDNSTRHTSTERLVLEWEGMQSQNLLNNVAVMYRRQIDDAIEDAHTRLQAQIEMETTRLRTMRNTLVMLRPSAFPNAPPAGPPPAGPSSASGSGHFPNAPPAVPQAPGPQSSSSGSGYVSNAPPTVPQAPGPQSSSSAPGSGYVSYAPPTVPQAPGPQSSSSAPGSGYVSNAPPTVPQAPGPQSSSSAPGSGYVSNAPPVIPQAAGSHTYNPNLSSATSYASHPGTISRSLTITLGSQEGSFRDRSTHSTQYAFTGTAPALSMGNPPPLSDSVLRRLQRGTRSAPYDRSQRSSAATSTSHAAAPAQSLSALPSSSARYMAPPAWGRSFDPRGSADMSSALGYTSPSVENWDREVSSTNDAGVDALQQLAQDMYDQADEELGTAPTASDQLDAEDTYEQQ